MAQILLIESDESLRKILKLNIMKNINCDVIEMNSAVSASSMLLILPDIELIICREKIGLEKSSKEMALFLEKNGMSTPLIVVTSQSWKELVLDAGRILGVSANNNQTISPYVPVGIHNFLTITSLGLLCDVYIRVKKNEHEFQYIKRLHEGDYFTKADIEKYQESGLKELFIPRDHLAEFVNHVTKNMVDKLDDLNVNGSDLIELGSMAFEVTRERINALGIDELTLEIVRDSIRSMENSIGEKNALSNFLKTLKENKFSYAYAHSYLTCLILHKVVAYFDWESPQVRDKLTYAAYFHDMGLNDSEQMRITSEADLKNSSLNEEEEKLVLNHALQSSLILEKFPKIPNGVSTIVKEHHGSRTGTGFSDSLSISITPISMMFIVVENFVEEFLKIKGNPKSSDFENIFASLKKRYYKITYQQTLNALESMTLKKNKQAS
ncbi:MAG: hypothetical protein ACXVLQ_06395 [Bacteriovorax sp.]